MRLLVNFYFVCWGDAFQIPGGHSGVDLGEGSVWQSGVTLDFALRDDGGQLLAFGDGPLAYWLNLWQK